MRARVAAAGGNLGWIGLGGVWDDPGKGASNNPKKIRSLTRGNMKSELLLVVKKKRSPTWRGPAKNKSGRG